ncbi:hypothetical protein [Hominifimenecus sp. rT4P-3]|uniref:hypothetical protein n=1 Tax=Hominifimenecus sp. rT4P-3 TaxID=3242979 RepID=UPI003DA22587
MSIQKLDFGQPLFEMEYVENEERYFVKPKSMVINLAERSQTTIWIKGIPLLPLKGTIVEGVWLENIGRALVILDYERYDIEDPEVIARIKSSWKSLYECSGIERHKGIPYFKSPKVRVGGDTELNVCFTEAMAPSGPHRDHDRDFDEVHAQIRGFGKMQKFEENDTSTFYQEFIMAPGIVHDKFYNEKGEYPWHQYHSITRAVYMPIEIDR